MRNPKPDFPTVIKTSIPSITKHSWNINSKRNTNQDKITFKPDISKPHLLSFLHSMYNSIKLSNHSSPHTPTEDTSTSSKSKIPLSAPSVLVLTQHGEENSYLTGRRRRTLPLWVLIPKNLITLKSNISFFVETFDEFPTRQVKYLITEIVLEISILSWNSSIIPHTLYYPNRKSYHTKLNQFNQRTTITLNKRKEALLEKWEVRIFYRTQLQICKTLEHSKNKC